MKTVNRLITWFIAIAIMISVPLIGWKILLSQSREPTENVYEYDIEKYKAVDQSLIHYNELFPITLEAESFHALAADSERNIYVSVDSKVIKMDPHGAVLNTAELEEPCYCITVVGNSSVYLGMQDHIEIYSSSLQKLSAWQSVGENARLTSLAASPTHLYAADSGSRTVWKFSLDGKLAGQLPAKPKKDNHYVIPSPYFDVAAGNSVWAANPGRTRIENYGPDDKHWATWGEPGMDIKGFSGCCNPSHIAVTPDEHIVTAEKGLPRIKVYDSEGNLASVAAAPASFSTISSGCFSEALIKDIAVDSEGRILVLDRGSKTIRIFTRKAK